MTEKKTFSPFSIHLLYPLRRIFPPFLSFSSFSPLLSPFPPFSFRGVEEEQGKKKSVCKAFVSPSVRSSPSHFLLLLRRYYSLLFPLPTMGVFQGGRGDGDIFFLLSSIPFFSRTKITRKKDGREEEKPIVVLQTFFFCALEEPDLCFVGSSSRRRPFSSPPLLPPLSLR